MQVLEENLTNQLVMTADGSTETKTKSSSLNQLLYGHGLFGLLDRGDEIWMNNGAEDEPKVTIIPGDDECYTLRIADGPDLTLGAHYKTDLVEAMQSMYEENDGESVAPLLELYESIRSNMIRDEILAPFLNVFNDKVAEKESGWFINGHLLLTYEGKFFHPTTDSKERSGSTVIANGSNVEAYSVNIRNPEEHMSRSITRDGEEYRLTDKEMRFLAKASWAIKNTPDRR
jgi:hypothetical protein